MSSATAQPERKKNIICKKILYIYIFLTISVAYFLAAYHKKIKRMSMSKNVLTIISAEYYVFPSLLQCFIFALFAFMQTFKTRIKKTVSAFYLHPGVSASVPGDDCTYCHVPWCGPEWCLGIIPWALSVSASVCGRESGMWNVAERVCVDILCDVWMRDRSRLCQHHLHCSVHSPHIVMNDNPSFFPALGNFLVFVESSAGVCKKPLNGFRKKVQTLNLQSSAGCMNTAFLAIYLQPPTSTLSLSVVR